MISKLFFLSPCPAVSSSNITPCFYQQPVSSHQLSVSSQPTKISYLGDGQERVRGGVPQRAQARRLTLEHGRRARTGGHLSERERSMFVSSFRSAVQSATPPRPQTWPPRPAQEATLVREKEVHQSVSRPPGMRHHTASANGSQRPVGHTTSPFPQRGHLSGRERITSGSRALSRDPGSMYCRSIG